MQRGHRSVGCNFEDGAIAVGTARNRRPAEVTVRAQKQHVRRGAVSPVKVVEHGQSTGRGDGVEGATVSPDGRNLLFDAYDLQRSNIVLVEGSR
jgi:hypothetical protein